MQLSPYTQYYIRRLLRQYLNGLNYPVSGVGISAYFQEDIYRHLKQLYPSSLELKAKVQELEMLVQHHQMSDVEKPYRTESLSGIEQKILGLLDLKFLALLTSLSLTVLPEAEASRFHFVQENRVQEGIRCSEDLYGMVFAFGAKHDPQIYQLLLTLIGQRVPFVLAVSEHRHSIWVSLRSPLYDSLPKPLLSRLAKPIVQPAHLSGHLSTSHLSTGYPATGHSATGHPSAGHLVAELLPTGLLPNARQLQKIA